MNNRIESMQSQSLRWLQKFGGDYAKRHFIGFVLCFASLTCFSEAQQLQWENEELVFNPSPTDKTVVAHFKFKNIGEAEAKIGAVNSSCSCTTLALAKKNFDAGEEGEVTATFTIGVRTGLQEKVIIVESNDTKHPQAILRMKVTIPEVAQLRPTFLYWSPAEPLTAKEMTLEVTKGFPVKAITVESSNAKVTAKVEPVKPGGTFRIVVTPSATDQPIMATLSIKTDYPQGNPKTFSASVRVQPRE